MWFTQTYINLPFAKNKKDKGPCLDGMSDIYYNQLLFVHNEARA